MRGLLSCGLAVASLGCGFKPSATGDAASTSGGDGMISDTSTITGGDAQLCYGSGLVRVCLTQLPTTTYHVTANTDLNTDTAANCAPLSDANAGLLCVVAGTAIQIDATQKLTAHGTKPLVLVSTSTIQIDGTIDAASHRTGTTGPGANPATCPTTVPPNQCGGGGGGGFGSVGGAGGNVNTGNCSGATGGSAGGTVTPTALTGGCKGTNGGANAMGVGPGLGGAGGGGVYLIAASTIVVSNSGVINASGAGGGGASNNSQGGGGGGGGGAGGMIGFDAITTTIQGTVFANGGGGGAGADYTNPSQAGSDATSASTAAPGGMGNATIEAFGGAGAFKVTAALPGVTNFSGGGGGGGVGIVKTVGTFTIAAGVVSPAP
jgi:hypothetical protein